MTRWRTAILIIGVATSSCRAGAGASEPRPAGSADPHERNGVASVRLDEAQLQQIRIEELSPHATADTISATGAVEFNAERMARVLPPVAGQVVSLSANVGDSVAQGGVLFVLSSREVAAAIADHLAAHKDLDLAEKTAAMTQDLFDHQAASRIALQQADNELAKSKARVAQSEEVLRVYGLEAEQGKDAAPLQSKIPVRAPIAGTIVERNITTGQFVGPDNPPLVTIADLASVWVQADIYERDMRRIVVGQEADVATPAYPDDHFIARVTRIGNTVDPQTRTTKVRVLVTNGDRRLKPGMFTVVGLSVARTDSALTVPVKAVFVENGKSFAYVQTGRQEFGRREVETSGDSTDRLRVVRGLAVGDHVIIDGVLLLRQLEADSPGQ